MLMLMLMLMLVMMMLMMTMMLVMITLVNQGLAFDLKLNALALVGMPMLSCVLSLQCLRLCLV